MSKRIKDLITGELEAKFRGADSVVVVDYIGINASDSNRLRGNLRKKQARMTVVRNALAARALGNVGLKGADSLLVGTSALVYGGESIVDLVKELLEQAKGIDKLKIKGSLVEGQLLDQQATTELAKLPNKKELQSMIVAQALSPARTLAGQIVGPGRNVGGLIKAGIEKKEKEEAPAAAAA
jgi:large subunit ribosomal protein L10